MRYLQIASTVTAVALIATLMVPLTMLAQANAREQSLMTFLQQGATVLLLSDNARTIRSDSPY